MPKIRDKTGFSKRLTKLMEKQKLTVRRAASIAGVNTSTIQSWRTDSLPSDFEAVKKLCQHFEVDFEWLLTGEKETQNIEDILVDAGQFFEGYAKISIQRLVPKSEVKSKKSK